MVDVYSSVDAGDEVESATRRPEDIIIRIALQTVECGLFILHYTFGPGEAGHPFIHFPIVCPDFHHLTHLPDPQPQAIGDTADIVSRLSNALVQLKAESGPVMMPPTPFVSARASRQVELPGMKTFSLRAL